MSFRLRLLVVMMALVAGMTGATLYVAQRRLAAAQERLFEQQFASERELHRARQESRLRGFQATAQRFAKVVRLQALLRRLNAAAEGKDLGDYAATAERLYQTAEDELREVLNPSNAAPGAQLAAFFRLLDSGGAVVPPPSGLEVGRFRPGSEKELAGQLTRVFQAPAASGGALVGYLTAETPSGQRRLLEVIFTRVLDVGDGTPLGALALGFASPETDAPGANAAPPMTRGGTVKGGIWLAGELFSRSIPPAMRPELAEQFARALQATRQSSDSFPALLGGDPHRIFFAELTRGSPFPRADQLSAFSLQEALLEQAALRRGVVSYGLLALAGSLVLSWLLAHGLSVPIRQLVAATTEVQRGNLAVRVPVRGRNELGRLAESFNDMTAGLALKEKYRSVLNLVTDKRVADELVAGRIELGGEERDVSVLFCDIRGFTALTQNMPPAEVIRMLNEHFTPLTGVVYEHQGVVDKFVGDLIMAVFGAPKSSGQDAVKAARCALSMIEARRTLNGAGRHQIEIGIGIASGPALAGCMGSSDRLNYTVVGERVNLASRLCGQAGRMEVVIDQTTRERLGDSAKVEPRSQLKLKGFSEAVQAYKLTELPRPVEATPVTPANPVALAGPSSPPQAPQAPIQHENQPRS